MDIFDRLLPTQKKCCCCIGLRYGCFIIGIINMLGFVNNTPITNKLDNTCYEATVQMNCPQSFFKSTWFFSCAIIMNIVDIIASLILFIGLVKMKKTYVTIFLCDLVVQLLFIIITWTALFFMGLFSACSTTLMSEMSCIFAITFIILITLYMMTIVKSYRAQMTEAEPSGQATINYVPSSHSSQGKPAKK